ncbi:MAG TPA: hypothetical protein VGP94_04095 [Tepidisphaeraceae bacterium]|jgi:hypothetical protein|nr:hypothetical protein [Tepidisphaeraceae bacterium]
MVCESELAPVSDIDPSTNLSDALSELIAFDAQGRAIWPAKQLEMMLQQPLADFEILLQIQTPIGSVRELLEHANPPIDLLMAVKELSKRHRKDQRSNLPPEMALLLYYGSIAAAMVRCGQKISKLRDDDLRNGFTWAIKEQWVPEKVCELFRQALSKLSGAQKWRE